METEILDNVGSYGRQLGRLGEALEVLVRRLPRSELTESELAAIEAFSSADARDRKDQGDHAAGARQGQVRRSIPSATADCRFAVLSSQFSGNRRA